jgi:hypothetical protein
MLSGMDRVIYIARSVEERQCLEKLMKPFFENFAYKPEDSQIIISSREIGLNGETAVVISGPDLTKIYNINSKKSKGRIHIDSGEYGETKLRINDQRYEVHFSENHSKSEDNTMLSLLQ